MTSSPRRDLLIELGTEELPPKALRALELALADGLRLRLEQAGLAHGAVESFATPRRLAVRVRRVASEQGAQRIRRRGPPLRAAFDANGAPTRAALAFAAGCGVAPEALGRERDERGTEYLAFEGQRPGLATSALLPAMLQGAFEALPTPRRMRWAAFEVQFVRPVRWLVVLLGREVVPLRLLECAAAASTRGHRLMADRPLRIASPGAYERTLQQRGRVIAGFLARRERVRAEVQAAAEALGGRAIVPAALLEEVTALVEWPAALAGRFEERFLALPREVLIATLQEHQRYFAVEDPRGALLPWFITVCNIESPQPQLVRAGNERVVRARLADAAFFWEQDRRTPLAARRAELDAVSYQAQLGSLAQRTERIGALARAIAAAIGADAAQVTRAAELCKCDLLTAMVGEFPELQGAIGRHYALADGEHPAVAEAIREHYLPRLAGDALPASRVGEALALADKLDALAGAFATDQRPSGTKDPFGLRRAAIGLVRIVLEGALELDLPGLLERAVGLQPLPDAPERAPSVAAEIYAYVLERLRAQYLEAPEEPAAPVAAGAAAVTGAAVDRAPLTTEMFDAVLAVRPRSLLDFDARLRALARFLARPEGPSLAAANKRIANILRKSEAVEATAIDAALLRDPAERALHEALQVLADRVRADVARRDYARALDALASLKGTVDAFFDRVLVNDPDRALRENRFALLRAVQALFGGIAELSRLPG